MTKSTVDCLVQSLWESYLERGITAAVARQFQDLPYRTHGDLDVFVLPKHLEVIRATTIEVAQRLGWKVLAELKEWNHHHLTLWRRGDRRRAPEVLPLDFQTCLGRRGFYYAPVGPFLANTRRYRKVAVLEQVPRTTALALHCLLDKSQVDEKYRQVLRRSPSGSALSTFAESVLPHGAVEPLLDWIASGVPSGRTATVRRELRRVLRRAYPWNLVRPMLYAGYSPLSKRYQLGRGVHTAIVEFTEEESDVSVAEEVLSEILALPIQAHLVSRTSVSTVSDTGTSVSSRMGGLDRGSGHSHDADDGVDSRVALERLISLVGELLRYLTVVWPRLVLGRVVLTRHCIQRDQLGTVSRKQVSCKEVELFPRPDRRYVIYHRGDRPRGTAEGCPDLIRKGSSDLGADGGAYTSRRISVQGESRRDAVNLIVNDILAWMREKRKTQIVQ